MTPTITVIGTPVNRQWWVVGALVALLLLLIGVGWLVRDRFMPVEVGTAAPDFSATTLQGEPVGMANLRGQVVLLNIWATWCPPCREEMPSMQRLHQRFEGQDLRVVAVSVDRGLGLLDALGNVGGDVPAFARELGLTFDVWLDPSGRVQRRYRVGALPESFVIDRTGTIVSKAIGAEEWDSEGNVALIQRLLAQ